MFKYFNSFYLFSLYSHFKQYLSTILNIKRILRQPKLQAAMLRSKAQIYEMAEKSKRFPEIRTVYDIMDYLERNGKEGMLL